MKKLYVVRLGKFAEKQLKKIPKIIQETLQVWVESVELEGLPAVRRLPGYHDEPLRGDRQGERSARLNRSYRVIYIEQEGGGLVVVAVQEVNKHVY